MRIKTFTRQYCSLIPYWVTIGIVTKGNSRFVHIESSIHVVKRIELKHSYSLKWSDRQILQDSDLLRYLKAYS